MATAPPGSYTRATPSTYDFNQSPNAASDAFAETLQFSENLFNGMRDLEKVRQARANTTAQAAALRTTKAQVSYGLKQAYEGYMYSKSFQKLTIDILRRRQENLRIVELRFQSGRENKGSVLLSSANVEQARFDDLQAKDLQEVAKTQLKKVLGLDQYEDVELSEEIPLRKWDNRMPDFVKISEQVPDFQQAIAQYESARHAVDIARGTFLPTLIAATAEYAARKASGVFLPTVPHWTLGISMPAFDPEWRQGLLGIESRRLHANTGGESTQFDWSSRCSES